MTRLLLGLSVSCVAALSLAACGASTRSPSPPKLDPADVTVDGLYRVADSKVAIAYLRPGADLASYRKIKLDLVNIAYKSPPRGGRYRRAEGNFPLTPAEMDRVKREFREAFVQELAKSRYEVVERPGPDVLGLDAEIVDLVVRAPPEPTTGQSWVFVQSAGELTLVAELRDSMTGGTLARLADRRAVQSPGAGASGLYYSTPVNNWADLRRLFQGWARLLREALDEAHQLQAETFVTQP